MSRIIELCYRSMDYGVHMRMTCVTYSPQECVGITVREFAKTGIHTRVITRLAVGCNSMDRNVRFISSTDMFTVYLFI